MGLRDITRDAVLKAMADCDTLGREVFLEKYGFGPAHEYFLEHDGKLYDSKAIVGVAHGFSGPGFAQLTAQEFAGGDSTVAPLLERLGFRIARGGRGKAEVAESEPGAKRNPTWAEEELVLALELYLSDGMVGDKHPKAVALSELLNKLPIHTTRPDAARFRNPNGVGLKLANFAALDPSYQGKGMSRGGRRDAEIWDRFSGDEDALRLAAERIRSGVEWRAQASSAAAMTFSTTAVEALNAAHFVMERVATTVEAQRREQQLVMEYKAHLAALGHKVARHKYEIDNRTLFCDLFDATETEWCLFEAKGDVSREALRMAVGQLFDYRRFYQEKLPTLVVLLARRPAADLERYLESAGVRVVFKTAGGGWDGSGVAGSGR